MNISPSRRASAGFGLRRGRFPGAAALGCPSSSQLCEPRLETVQPTPGMIGVSAEGSEGVAEKALPSASITVQ